MLLKLKLSAGACMGAALLLTALTEPLHAQSAAAVCNPTGSGARSLSDVIAVVDKATVMIKVMVGDKKSTATGSGVIFDQKADYALVLTNDHVAGKATRIVVITIDGTRYDGTLVGSDEKIDLAVVKIKATGLPVVALGSSAGLRPGDPVFAIGNPLGFPNIITHGIIDGANSRMPEVPALMTDAGLNHGNSGGALFNYCGQVVGINTAIMGDGPIEFPGFSFAIPVDTVKRAALDIIDSGKVRHARLGVQMATESSNKKDPLAETKVVVKSIFPDTAAFKAGLKPGDVVTAVDRKHVSSSGELKMIVDAKVPGETITLDIMRGTSQMEIAVKLSELPDSKAQKKQKKQ